jgi:hypothetical protein
VKVHLWGHLAFYGPQRRGCFEVRIENTMPLDAALRLVGVPKGDIAATALNGVAVRPDQPAPTVTDQDRLDLFPPTSGG